MVPASTGAALATTRALPQYEGLFDGVALRVPIPAGSIADITFLTSRSTTAEEVNRILEEESITPRYSGILGVSRDPIVSSDIIKNPHSAVFDAQSTMVLGGRGRTVKVLAWYDNEWGYSNRVCDLIKKIAS